MSTYPPNNTTPKSPSGNYLWNWLGSPLKKFAAALSPYMGGDVGYKKYVALLSQSGINDPTAIVLENNTGLNINFIRQINGIYMCEIPGAFDNTKTVVFTASNDENDFGFIWWGINTPDQLLIRTKDQSLNYSDGILSFTSIEIRVYP